MNKIISVLQKTTRQTAAGLVVLGLIVVASPFAVFAENENHDDNDNTGHTPVQVCHKGEIKTVDDDAVSGHLGHGDFVITNDNRDTCKKEGDDNDNNDDNNDKGTLTITKVIRGTETAHFSDFSFVVNDGSSVAFEEDGTNKITENVGEYSVHEVAVDNYTTEYSSNAEGHAHDCSHLKVEEEENVTCTIINTYHAPETPKSCVFGSDPTTLVGTAAAVPSFVHPVWNTSLVSAAPLTQWIWNAFHATPSNTTDEIVTFTKKFNVVGTPSSVKLDLAADNYYSVSVNGNPSCADQANLDNFSAVEPTCDITSLVHTGVNTLTFVVNNKSGFGTNPETNPGGLIYKVTIGGATCSEVPTEPTYAKVHLYKYLSNGETEAQVPDTFTGPQFPMTATWSALNIGAGSGAYALGYGHGGAAFKWAADTSAMQEPVVHYTSSEVTGGDSPVVASREQCSPGKYFLKGYRSGTSLSAAEEATLSSTAPDYTNFTGDRYVIVVNQACPEAPTTSSVSATKVVCTDEADLPNWGAGGQDITATTATNWVAEHKSCSIVPWDFQWAPSSAGNPGDNTLGTPEGWSSFVSGLATVPANAMVWVREKINPDYIPFTGADSSNNVSAEMYCSNDVLNYDNFDFINPVEAGHTYYCVGFNTPKPQKTTSSSTVIVTGNTSAGENLLGWMFNRDTSTQTPFEFNTDASSIGTGSLFVKPITNTINGNNDKFVGELFLLTPISGLNNISYDFKIGAPDATAKDQFYMNVYANFGESSPTKFYDCRYNVVPTVGSTGGFTTVTFDPTQSYPVTTRGGATPSPHTCPASPSGMQALSASGTATIRMVAINVGDQSGSDTGVSGYFDKVVTSITSGLNTHTTTYDFEPVDMCSNIQGTQTTVPEGMTVNDGVCTTPVVETPTVTTPTTTGGGRSGSRRGGGGSVLGASTGQVLGESCGLYLEKHLRLGSKKNDSEQTKKLQTFLNKWMGTTLPISGLYDSATEKAVKAFQAKYASDILTPWKIGAPTGLVYFTTLHKINELECPEAAGAKPTNLVDWSKNRNAQ